MPSKSFTSLASPGFSLSRFHIDILLFIDICHEEEKSKRQKTKLTEWVSFPTSPWTCAHARARVCATHTHTHTLLLRLFLVLPAWYSTVQMLSDIVPLQLSWRLFPRAPNLIAWVKECLSNQPSILLPLDNFSVFLIMVKRWVSLPTTQHYHRTQEYAHEMLSR